MQLEINKSDKKGAFEKVACDIWTLNQYTLKFVWEFSGKTTKPFTCKN